MKNDTFDRRAFLKSAVAGTAAAATTVPTLPLAAEAQQSPPTPAPAATSQGYSHLNPAEAAFIEAVVDHEGVGPDLHGVFGRRAGALENFRYSPALKRSGITWTPQALDGYIADPQNAVPANRMPYAGMPDARDRADVISYLQNAFK
jgi:cytochrome c2